MKWRHSVIYLVILLLIGGYYYYFEVVKKEQKQAVEKENKRVFHFQVDTVQGMEVLSKEKPLLELRKEALWEIVKPIRAEVGKDSFVDFLNSVASLEAEKEIIAAPEDLKVFGLNDPPLKIRLQTGEQWVELLLGDKNPTGDGYYAKTNEKPNVFLVASGNWGALNRNLNELRRRELFKFQIKDVTGIRLAWHDGGSVRLDCKEDGSLWQDPDHPEVKVKTSKVQNVLEQIHWLRATNFLENEAGNLASNGLEHPLVTVSLRFKEDRTAELLLGKMEKGGKQLTALSSELPAVVEVDAAVLNDLPKDLQSLEDRTLLGVERGAARQIKWRLGESEGHVVQLDENQWGVKTGDRVPEALKESWPVKSLLWDIADAEYQKKLDPPAPPPPRTHARVEIWSAERNLVSLSWEKVGEKDSGPVTLWLEKEGKTDSVQVDTEVVRKIEGDFGRILHPDREKKSS